MINRKYDDVEALDSIRSVLGAAVGDRLNGRDYKGAMGVVAFAQADYWGTLNNAFEKGILTTEDVTDARKRALTGPFGEFRALISRAQDHETRLKADAVAAMKEAEKYGF